MSQADAAINHNGLMQRPPTREEINNAAHAAQALAIAMDIDDGLQIPGDNGDPVRIAPAIGQLIIELLSHVSNGSMVTLVPIGAILTTQQAADLLNISRPHLIKLLKEGKIEHHMVGTHRRIPLQALLSYRDEKRMKQNQTLNDLARLGQEYDQA